MKLEQNLRQRSRDGKWEVWQRLLTHWGSEDIEAGYWSEEWMPVAVFRSKDAAIRFWNACFLSSNAIAPTWAGAGTGSSLSEPWISALSR